MASDVVVASCSSNRHATAPVRPRRESQLLDSLAQRSLNFIARFAVSPYLFWPHLGVTVERAVFLQTQYRFAGDIGRHCSRSRAAPKSCKLLHDLGWLVGIAGRVEVDRRVIVSVSQQSCSKIMPCSLRTPMRSEGEVRKNPGMISLRPARRGRALRGSGYRGNFLPVSIAAAHLPKAVAPQSGFRSGRAAARISASGTSAPEPGNRCTLERYQ